jgi:hypothetical protein
MSIYLQQPLVVNAGGDPSPICLPECWMDLPCPRRLALLLDFGKIAVAAFGSTPTNAVCGDGGTYITPDTYGFPGRRSWVNIWNAYRNGLWISSTVITVYGISPYRYNTAPGILTTYIDGHLSDNLGCQQIAKSGIVLQPYGPTETCSDYLPIATVTVNANGSFSVV